MKITVMAGEKAGNKGLKTDKEPSYLIRTGDRTLLYGFGTGKTVAENVEKTGVPCDFIDTAFLPRATVGKKSGLGAFLNANRRANVYARVNAFDGHFAKGLFGYKSAGADNIFARYRRILRCKNYFLSPDGQFLLFSSAAQTDGGTGFFGKDGAGKYVPDDFSHELYLIVAEKKKCVLFCGECRTGLSAVLGEAQRLASRHFGGKIAAAFADSPALSAASAAAAGGVALYTVKRAGEMVEGLTVLLVGEEREI